MNRFFAVNSDAGRFDVIDRRQERLICSCRLERNAKYLAALLNRNHEDLEGGVSGVVMPPRLMLEATP